MIVKRGSTIQVKSQGGKNMGKYKSMKAAKKRLRQIEYFKRQKG